jgi:hypothetical protein
MNHQKLNFESPEEELEPITKDLTIPLFFQLFITLISLCLIALSGYLLNKYLESPSTFATPSESGAFSMFIFSISALCLAWIPWKKLGVKITRIGGVEFKEIVKVQATEHAEELSYIQERLETLEHKVYSESKQFFVQNVLTGKPLTKLLLTFLETYEKWAFSPSRIKMWGAKQQGFSSLSDYELPFIRITLQKMLTEGTIETTLSKKGNTLYRLKKA